MLFCRKKKYPQNLQRELSGLVFSHPIGAFVAADTSMANTKLYVHTRPGFLLLDAPGEQIIPWIDGLRALRKKEDMPLGVNIRHCIVRTFSLVYDFADFIIIEPDENDGLFSEDAADTNALLDELLALRLCYERYTPIYLRLYKGLTPDEITPLLSYSQLSGIDGVVVPDCKKLNLVKEKTLGRLPVIGSAENTEDALALYAQGATLIEAKMRPLPLTKLISTLEKQSQQHD